MTDLHLDPRSGIAAVVFLVLWPGGEAERVFSKEELLQYDGSVQEKGPYLSVLGSVFDVSARTETYGPGGSYGFFSGRDGSRAFHTGQFDQDGLVDRVEDMEDGALDDIHSWLEFFQNSERYSHVGVVEGTYYDRKGAPTDAMRRVEERVKKERDRKAREEAVEEARKRQFPPCNSEWSRRNGHRVWCSAKSGGISREWVGVPRRLYLPGSSESRCVCVRTFGRPTGQEEKDGNGGDGNGGDGDGDLSNPNLREYEDCHPEAEACQLEQPRQEGEL